MHESRETKPVNLYMFITQSWQLLTFFWPSKIILKKSIVLSMQGHWPLTRGLTLLFSSVLTVNPFDLFCPKPVRLSEAYTSLRLFSEICLDSRLFFIPFVHVFENSESV